MWVFRSYSLTKSIDKSSSIIKLTLQMTDIVPFLIHNSFITCIVTSVQILKCLNFWMLELNVEMSDWFNALKLAKYRYMFFCLFFFHVVVFILKMFVAGKQNVPKNTLSTWLKNKEKLFDSLKKRTNVKRQNWNQAIMNWWTRLFLVGS